jgi:hypothetical protein
LKKRVLTYIFLNIITVLKVLPTAQSKVNLKG